MCKSFGQQYYQYCWNKDCNIFCSVSKIDSYRHSAVEGVTIWLRGTSDILAGLDHDRPRGVPKVPSVMACLLGHDLGKVLQAHIRH